MSKINRIILFSLFIVSNVLFGQDTSNAIFVEPEVSFGSIVPNFPNFPKTGLSRSVGFAIGKTKVGNQHWSNYYNKPSFGLGFSYTENGNTKELGREYGMFLFLELSPQKKTVPKWFFKLAMGSTYFSEHYRVFSNENNEIIGSYWNWRFQAFLYHKLKEFKQLSLRIGGGYVHSSNGHTQLPNYGMNAAMLSLSARFYRKENPYLGNKPIEKEGYTKQKRKHFIQTRFGIGMHEYGATTEPVGGAKKGVYSVSINYGTTFNQQLKVRTGFVYRFYQHYYDQIKKSENRFSDRPSWNASNLYWLLGIEYLLGNFAIDVEGGINLHKPYYSAFFDEFETKQGLKKFLKSTFPMRLGLNYYYYKPSKNKKYNLFIGASINANFGQADFSQLNLGVYRRIRVN